jgi:hypothetical protein
LTQFPCEGVHRRFNNGPETQSAAKGDLTSEKGQARGLAPAPIADAGQTRSPNATSSRTNVGLSSTTIICTSQSTSLHLGFMIQATFIVTLARTLPSVHYGWRAHIGHRRQAAHAYLDVNVESTEGETRHALPATELPRHKVPTRPRGSSLFNRAGSTRPHTLRNKVGKL